MFVTADQLAAHAIGDYILQSDWMANNKTKHVMPALVHCWLYTCMFLAFDPSWIQLAFIFLTHFFIDHYRLARYLVWFKNHIAPAELSRSWVECKQTGYPPDRPEWLTVWLLIIVDNIMHVICNAIALKYL